MVKVQTQPNPSPSEFRIRNTFVEMTLYIIYLFNCYSICPTLYHITLYDANKNNNCIVELDRRNESIKKRRSPGRSRPRSQFSLKRDSNSRHVLDKRGFKWRAGFFKRSVQIFRQDWPIGYFEARPRAIKVMRYQFTLKVLSENV